MNLLGHIAQRSDIADEKLNEFLISTKDSEFLFKKDILEYLDEIYKNAVDESRNKTVEKEIKEIFDWFTSQLDVSKKRFAKYLSFKNI